MKTIRHIGLIFVSILSIFSFVYADTQTTFSPSSCTFNNLDLQEVMEDEVDHRVNGLTASSSNKLIFTTRGSNTNPWTRNTNVWTSRGTSSIDLTGISSWNTSGTYQRAGVLITPQHIVMASHWAVANGGTVVFVDNDNNIITRTVSSSTSIIDPNTGGNTDIKIGVLNSPVPAEITHYPVLSSDQFTDYLQSVYGDRLPLMALNYDGEALIRDTSNIAYYDLYNAYFYYHQIPSDVTRASFYEPPISGDSGQPSFLIVGGKPILVMVNTFTSSGASMPTYFTQIEETIDLLSDSIGGARYDVSTYDLDCLVKFPKISGAALNINENSVNTSLVGQAPISFESGYNFDLSVIDGNLWDTFTVSTSGQITINNNEFLDYGTKDTFSLSMSVTYSGTDYDYMSGEGIVTINVNDIEEVPVLSNETFSINENASNGTTVDTVTTDHDDEGQTLEYSIVSGNDSGAFSIDSSGNILVADSTKLNYENVTQYSLVVSAIDDGPNTSTGTSTVIININNVNEAPIVSNQNFSVNESASADTLVGTVVASDVDVGQILSYQINSGNTGSVFSINSDGQIRVARDGLLSNEVKSLYNLTIQVTDNGTPSSNTIINVGITIEDRVSSGSGGGGSNHTSEQRQIQDLENQILELTKILNQLRGVSDIINLNVNTFSRDLTLGMQGEDVRSLQKYLNSNGFIVSEFGPGSPGNETNLFGALTKEALIKFQKSKGITPAIGYFGPVTRGFFNLD